MRGTSEWTHARRKVPNQPNNVAVVTSGWAVKSSEKSLWESGLIVCETNLRPSVMTNEWTSLLSLRVRNGGARSLACSLSGHTIISFVLLLATGGVPLSGDGRGATVNITGATAPYLIEWELGYDLIFTWSYSGEVSFASSRLFNRLRSHCTALQKAG